MSLLPRFSRSSAFLSALALVAILSPSFAAQQPAVAPGKALTVERIYAQPSLSGRLKQGRAWAPQGKELGYFETKGSGKEAKTELWVMHPPNGHTLLLLPPVKLHSILA